MRRVYLAATLLAASALIPGAVPALQAQGSGSQESESTPSIEDKTEGMEKREGFIPVYWDSKTGKIFLEIGRMEEEILYYPSLPAGMGQNDIGLNRGDLGSPAVVFFQRVGPKVLMVEPNYSYRAESEDPLERKSVDDGFPTSIHWGFEVSAETGDRALVDATDFFLRDAHGVARTLQRTRQGTFHLDKSRSAIFLPRTRAFPENTEVEMTLTFTSDEPGNLVRSVTPSPDALTLREHHSFVELPEVPMEKRKADPRAGFNGITYMDYAAPLGEPLEKRFIARHRIEKKDPAAAMSEPVEPIVYYLDPGTPEPIRSALLEGASWWNQAFEAAGFINGFQVTMLPADADPMDARYNMIQWVHRSTRGWSYGNSIVDPRTGEILKGHVTLGSLRVRQDWLIGEGLTSPYKEGDEYPDEIREMALARIRQLGAHEVGHTIGLSHNYISSAQTAAGKYSVMDYPHPLIELDDQGNVELRDAYPHGIGDWDKVWIKYGYSDFAPGTNEDEALEDILMEAADRGLTFISDQDARPAGSAHPNVHLWDNGANAAKELNRMLEVRRVALDRFGENAIQTGMPMATMEEALVPLYLHHRYQTEATSKVVAGQYYTYAMRGDGQDPLRPVPADEQEEALDALLRTLDPAVLAIPRSILENLPPRPFRYNPHQELFNRNTGLVFDAVAPATAAADMTISFLFHPERAARMVQQRALYPDLPGLTEIIHTMAEALFNPEFQDPYQAEINRSVERVFVDRLIALAAQAPMAQVRAEVVRALSGIEDHLSQMAAEETGPDQAHYILLSQDIQRFMDRPYNVVPTPDAPATPPGSPIGGGGMGWLDGLGGQTALDWDAWSGAGRGWVSYDWWWWE